MRRITLRLAFFLVVATSTAWAETRTIARCGDGYLELVEGYRVLHLKGTPHAMGFQHGTLLRDEIRELVRFLFDVKAKEFDKTIGEELGKGPLKGLAFKPDARSMIQSIAGIQKKFVPEWYAEELRGVAEGSGVSFEEIQAANFIPELFHCSGFAIKNSATQGGALYHGRILDYGIDWRLQEFAVLVVAEPEGKIPFLNVTYAGFIGSVTGMNREAISIGEMGGRGLGHWAGVPMTVLMRWVLQEAHTLDEAVAVFRDQPRTCEYYYVIADGKSGEAVGMEASWNAFFTLKPGEPHSKLPEALPDCVLMSAGDRYTELVKRVRAGFGSFDAEGARGLMNRPVAMKSNLHSVLFAPAEGLVWVANASSQGEPASSQPYQKFEFKELLLHQPDFGVQEYDSARVLAPSR